MFHNVPGLVLGLRVALEKKGLWTAKVSALTLNKLANGISAGNVAKRS